MRRVIVSNQISIDGVIESPSPDSWYIAEGEHEDTGSLDQLLAADDLLLGRKTYEGLAAVWPEITDDRGFADRVNSLPKHVASRTLQEPLTWNATLIKGDLAEYVADLKQQAGGNILVYGGGSLRITSSQKVSPTRSCSGFIPPSGAPASGRSTERDPFACG
jgi:dihydrofolate reductase